MILFKLFFLLILKKLFTTHKRTRATLFLKFFLLGFVKDILGWTYSARNIYFSPHFTNLMYEVLCIQICAYKLHSLKTWPYLKQRNTIYIIEIATQIATQMISTFINDSSLF